MDVLTYSSPVLRAPNAADRLDGLSLKEVFRKFILDDPAVSGLGKIVVKFKCYHADVFRDGMFPGLLSGHFSWPLDVTAKSLELSFLQQALRGDNYANPPDAVRAVSVLLADLMAALRDLLVAGKIIAFGTFMQTGNEGPISRQEWSRSAISIDVSNGDLCDGQDRRAVPKWTGLSLRLPDAPLLPNESQNDVAPKIAEGHRKAQTQIQTIEKFRLECLGWLETMMSNPATVPLSIADLWAQVKQNWGRRVSRRAFLKARDDAIANTEAWAWKVPGPKPKSRRS